MFDRQFANQLENLFSRDGSNADRVSRMSQGLLLLLQAILTILVAIKALWDNGFGERVENPENAMIHGYTRRWWLLASATYTIYIVAMKAPLIYLASLQDAQGNRPFAVFDPADLGELAGLTIEQVAWREPETSTPPGLDAALELQIMRKP
jgi:hypothetical protein